jgi:hypothetical protein
MAHPFSVFCSEDDSAALNLGDIRAKLPFVSQYFHEGSKWFFIDAHGQVQGPFSADNMTNWYKAGYFWNKDLLICHEGWEEYVTIESIVQSCSSVVRPLFYARDAAAGTVSPLMAGLPNTLSVRNLCDVMSCDVGRPSPAELAAVPRRQLSNRITPPCAHSLSRTVITKHSGGGCSGSGWSGQRRG